MKTVSIALLFFISTFLFAQNSYLAYESFNGNGATPLHNGSYGQGWASPWDVQNGFEVGYLHDNNSLTYNNLKTSGNKLTGGYLYVTAGRNLDYNDGGAFDNYVTGGDAIGSAAGTTLWVSVLLNKLKDNNEPIYIDLHNSNLAWCDNCTSNKVAIGYFGTASNVNGEKKWAIRIGSTVYNTSINCAINSTSLLVLKINFSDTKTDFDLYVNPSKIGIAGLPAAPSLTQSTSELIRLRSVAVYLGDNVNNGYADEIRFASTYFVVTADQNVPINLPPTAQFSMTPSSGEAPVTVNVDASASSDPEGGALTYSWNWGDGTPVSITSIATHTYSKDITGLITIELTVKDNLNLKNSTKKTIPIYIKGTNYFSCQSTGTSLSEASCKQNNGRIRINLGIATNPTYTFKNSQGIDIPQVNGNEYQNLANGKYFVTVTGSNGCRDEYSLLMTTDSSTCAGWSPNLCNMSIGVNINGLADWSWEHSFVNRFKHVREDMITFHSGCNCWDSNVGSQIVLDENGYPKGLPQATSASSETVVRWVISSGGGNLKPNEQYVLLYDGNGTISINGANAISNTKGKLLFSVPAVSENIWLDITYSQPDDYLRNFRLLKSSEEFIDLSINTFNTTFLSKLSPFSTIRFMDWGATNGNKLSKWEDRKMPSYRTYSGSRGVPYELMIQLANQTQKNVWICVPHLADSNYVVELAKLFKANLNPNLKIYLEYSNEVWNWQFEQAQYNNQTRPLNLNYGRASAEKSKKLFGLWKSVFGNEMNRVVRVLGLQAGYNYLNEEIISQLQENEWDMASLTYYFGLDHSSNGNPVLTATSNGEDVNRNARNNFFGSGNWWKTVKQDYRNIKMLGKAISSYEGGPHYTDFQTHPYQQAMYDAQYLQSMNRLYDDVLDSIRQMGNQLAMAFTLSGVQESVYGSWGHIPDMYMNPPFNTIAPKYQALLDNSCLPFQDLYYGQPVVFSAPSVFAKPGDTVMLDIKVKNFLNVTSGQFTMSFDTSVLKFISIKPVHVSGVNAGTFGTTMNLINRGKITMAYDAPASSLPDGISIYDGAIFCRLSLKVNNYVALGKSSPIDFDGSLTNIAFENKFGGATFMNVNGKVTIDNKLSVNENSTFEVNVYQNNNALLSWFDQYSNKTQGYLIERSRDGIQYDAIKYFDASKSNFVYNYIDSNLRNGIYYYKIKYLNADQTYFYSEIKSISIIDKNEIVIVPNPVKDEFSVQINHKLQPYFIYNQLGQLVQSDSTIPNSIDVSSFISGIYYFKVNGLIVKFVKVD